MTCGPRMAISPTALIGSIEPSSSRMAASVDGIGTPMLPLHSSMLSGLEIAIGAVSVRP